MRKNPYNAEYIMQRENLNRDDAEKFIENYKLNKATSLKGFIHRHGEVKGTEMFEKFKQTSVSRTASAFSTMEEYTKFNGTKFSNSEMTLTELYKLTGYKQNENKISNFNWS